MPVIYLSPSTQENNLYVTGGTEEEWMNRLADAMEPYLTASGIRYSRNTPDMTAASSIRASNAGNYDPVSYTHLKLVEQWRRKQSILRTRLRRPDLYAKLDLSSKEDQKLLRELEAEIEPEK